MMQPFVVAIEYRGADIDPHRDTARVAVLEHAYGLETATLAAHAGQEPRVAFPAAVRGWATPSESARCAECAAAVDEIVAAFVRVALRHCRPDIRRSR
ncbi:hypothetical protein [Jatrophihabitans lederbergiae]|uniref:hypothetical protein n=1 Tax=Jatrophihabitans lederbergiae TaxID=3075547 RepID=UPI00288A806C|nr:hypothetical protein [Jatrophihabitans sp. DSM 44399]